MTPKVKNHRSLPQQVSGFSERPPETFADVDRAVTKWLRENDPVFRAASEAQTLRNLTSRLCKTK